MYRSIKQQICLIQTNETYICLRNGIVEHFDSDSNLQGHYTGPKLLLASTERTLVISSVSDALGYFGYLKKIDKKKTISISHWSKISYVSHLLNTFNVGLKCLIGLKYLAGLGSLIFYRYRENPVKLLNYFGMFN